MKMTMTMRMEPGELSAGAFFMRVSFYDNDNDNENGTSRMVGLDCFLWGRFFYDNDNDNDNKNDIQHVGNDSDMQYIGFYVIGSR